MQLKCRSCNAELHPRDVDFDALRATCRRCGWQLGGDQQRSPYRAVVAADRDATAASDDDYQAPAAETRRQAVQLAQRIPPMPHYITVDERGQGPKGGSLLITVAPHRWVQGIFGLFVMALWAAILYLQARPIPWALVGPALAVGVLYIMTILVNHTDVTVAGGVLQVRHRPLPWPGRRLSTDGLVQLYVDERVHKNQRSYALCAKWRDKTITLVRGLREPQGALFLERKVETYLGIVDRPVDGEFVV